MATDSTVKILLGCLRSGCNCAADILSLDWVKMDLKHATEVQNLEVLYLSLSVKFLPHGSGEVQHSTFEIYILPSPKK